MIRPFAPKDLDTIASIWLEINLAAHAFIPAGYWRANLPAVREMLPRAEVYVYEIKDGIQGFIGLDDTYIAGIFVQKSAQSQGIGRELLDFAKKTKNSLSLHVYTQNQRAVSFYQREKFEILQEKTDSNTGQREYLMIWKNK